MSSFDKLTKIFTIFLCIIVVVGICCTYHADAKKVKDESSFLFVQQIEVTKCFNLHNIISKTSILSTSIIIPTQSKFGFSTNDINYIKSTSYKFTWFQHILFTDVDSKGYYILHRGDWTFHFYNNIQNKIKYSEG